MRSEGFKLWLVARVNYADMGSSYADAEVAQTGTYKDVSCSEDAQSSLDRLLSG